MKLLPFSIEKAKKGEPVVTEGGFKVTILAFDTRLLYAQEPHIAIVHTGSHDILLTFDNNGTNGVYGGHKFQLYHPEPEMWVNIITRYDKTKYTMVGIHSSKDLAKSAANKSCLKSPDITIEQFKLVKE